MNEIIIQAVLSLKVHLLPLHVIDPSTYPLEMLSLISYIEF